MFPANVYVVPDCESVNVYSPRAGAPFKHPVMELDDPAAVPEVVPICPVGAVVPVWSDGLAVEGEVVGDVVPG